MHRDAGVLPWKTTAGGFALRSAPDAALTRLREREERRRATGGVSFSAVPFEADDALAGAGSGIVKPALLERADRRDEMRIGLADDRLQLRACKRPIGRCTQRLARKAAPLK